MIRHKVLGLQQPSSYCSLSHIDKSLPKQMTHFLNLLLLEDIIRIATEQALAILRQMNENRESFRKIGLTFEEKAFYDILISLRDQYNFEYGTDQEVDGVVINDKCKSLAKKVKEIIDTKSSFSHHEIITVIIGGNSLIINLSAMPCFIIEKNILHIQYLSTD